MGFFDMDIILHSQASDVTRNSHCGLYDGKNRCSLHINFNNLRRNFQSRGKSDMRDIQPDGVMRFAYLVYCNQSHLLDRFVNHLKQKMVHQVELKFPRGLQIELSRAQGGRLRLHAISLAKDMPFDIW